LGQAQYVFRSNSWYSSPPGSGYRMCTVHPGNACRSLEQRQLPSHSRGRGTRAAEGDPLKGSDHTVTPNKVSNGLRRSPRFASPSHRCRSAAGQNDAGCNSCRRDRLEDAARRYVFPLWLGDAAAPGPQGCRDIPEDQRQSEVRHRGTVLAWRLNHHTVPPGQRPRSSPWPRCPPQRAWLQRERPCGQPTGTTPAPTFRTMQSNGGSRSRGPHRCRGCSFQNRIRFCPTIDCSHLSDCGSPLAGGPTNHSTGDDRRCLSE
jgi:hypothetical protein